ncbi:MAG: small-conductance mechanosensitive ion channel [Parcubacteria group bacterium Gr01-1014_38]|nr:MAG: small-conductance mechanosensitive ion channel [Parcubacteria group bacterium Gr01-1014_38]
MTVLELSQQAIAQSLVDLWLRFAGFLPVFLGALIVFIAGWIVAMAVGKFIQRILHLVRLNDPFERITGLRAALERAGLDLNVPKFIGDLVKWFLYIVTLLATADILGLEAVAAFLNRVIAYVPNIVVAAVILVAGVIFANFVGRVTKASIAAAGLPHSAGVSAVARWAVVIFTFLAAMLQLQVADVLIQTLFTAFAAMLAIAGGLAFGLGGKDLATRILKHLEDDMNSRR